MYLEPEQATESGYAIGSAVMSCRDLTKWAHALRWGGIWPLTPEAVQEMFSPQTHSDSPFIIDPAKSGDYVYPTPIGTSGWRGVNWGFGPQKLESATGASGDVVEIWGNVGQGGFGGYGGAVVWVEHDGTTLVVAANTNTGITVSDAYHAARDYIESFL